MNLIPLFDPKAKEALEKRALEQQAKTIKDRIHLFPEGDQSSGPCAEGNWLPQDACGGHQWNARMGYWQK